MKKDNKLEILWLIPVIHSGFGCFFAYDAIGAVSPVLKEEFGINNSEIGLLYSAYSASSILLSVACGIIVDKFGPKKVILVTTSLNSIGTAIVALSPNFGIMLFGQLLYGLGSAPLYITLVTTLEIWFVDSPNHRFRTTLTICICAFWLRLGSFLAFTILPIVINHTNLRVALWISCGTCVSSFISGLIFVIFCPWQPKHHSSNEEASARNSPTETENEIVEIPNPPKKVAPHEPFSLATFRSEVKLQFTNLKGLPFSYWFIAAIFVFSIPSIYTFSAFGTIILEENYKYSLQQAAFTTSLISLTNALTSPFVGTIVGYVGRRTYFAILGTALLTAFYTLFMSSVTLPIVIFLGVGISQSILDSVLFPSLSIIVPDNIAGIATGFMMFWYDTFLTVLPIAIGFLKDAASYIETISVLIGISGLTLLLAIVLKISDIRSNHVLDKTVLVTSKTVQEFEEVQLADLKEIARV